MRNFGECVGMAFQIKDDILDYDTGSDTGKPALNDLGEQKITLPLLAVLERSGPERRAELLERLSSARDCPENIAWLHDAVVADGGIAEAESVMQAYIARARSILAAYPVSPYHNSLALLASYAGGREK
jgi:octaprenyl-diphosphate synthase